MTGADVVLAARSYTGARWAHQQRSDKAMDCLGLVVNVARDIGHAVDDRTNYGLHAMDESMLQECQRQLVPVSRDDLKPGDVVVLRIAGNRHIGIVGDYKYGGLTLIHAQTRHPRCVVENQLSDEWLRLMKASIAGCFRFPGVINE